jgi:hypothetical protein
LIYLNHWQYNFENKHSIIVYINVSFECYFGSHKLTLNDNNQ